MANQIRFVIPKKQKALIVIKLYNGLIIIVIERNYFRRYITSNKIRKRGMYADALSYILHSFIITMDN